MNPGDFFSVIYEDGSTSDRWFNLDSAVWEAVEHANPGEHVIIQDQSEYTVWTITEGKIT